MARWREVEPDAEDLLMVEKVFDYMRYQRGVEPLQIGILGVEIHNNHKYLDNNIYVNDDEDGNFKNNSDRRSYCGFSSNFLSSSRGSRQHSSLRYNQRPVRAAPKTYAVESHDEKVARLLEERKTKEKTEKKRLKKLKQRERKRLEKEKENTVKNVQVNDDSAESTGINRSHRDSSSTGATEGKQDTYGDSDSNDNSDSSEDSSEDEESEEELDMNSCFISKAVDIAKRKLVQKPKPERKETKTRPIGQLKDKSNEGQKELIKNSAIPSTEDIVKRSTELAVIGNQFASTGCFDMAVKYFTDAIRHNPKEFRLFGNRSFCFEKMQEYERALTDAELALNMSPGWVKGLYRKGRALAGLKRYDEAIQALKEVLQQDSSCADAAQELMRVQITQLMEFGFSREQSSNALIFHGTVEKALQALSQMSGILYNGSFPAASPAHPAKVESASRTSTAASASTEPQPQAQDTPKPQAKSCPVKTKLEKTQPERELFSIWVGNLVPSVTETMIESLFCGSGEVHSIKLLRTRRCAFVNYYDPDNCEDAIMTYHGRELQGTRISVRYPDRIPTRLGISKSAHQAVDLPTTDTKQRECFFWRNLGCNRRPSCSFLHILEHKGIDRGKGKTSDK